MLLPSARIPQSQNTRNQCLFYTASFATRLPNEVWVHILECLPVQDILRCRQLCRKIKHVIDNTARIQYPIELFATGHVDGGAGNPLSTADRLARLRDIDRGWRTLEWKSHQYYPWNGDCPNYELAGGVFARGRSTLPDAGQFELDDFHHFTAAIDVIVFPTRDGNKEAPGWSHEQVGILVHDFTIAPEEDLVVLVGHRHEGAVDDPIPIHLRTLSSNKPHPMATLPALFAHPQPPDVFISDFTIQIYDSLLGILFWGSHAFHLMIWDWCSGEIIVDYPAPAGIHFDDFSFLSGSSFLIPSSSAAGAALRIYSFAHLLPPSDPAYEPIYKGPNMERPFADYPIGRAPHHLEFDNSGRRVAPACWTPMRPGVTVRSFHMGTHIFCVSHLGEQQRGESRASSGSSASADWSSTPGAGPSTLPHPSYEPPPVAPAGLSGLSRRPLLRSLLRFPKPKREWNVGIMTCRVDPLPRFEMRRPRQKEISSKRHGKDKGKQRADDMEAEDPEGEADGEDEEETRFAPSRPFHADPDRAIIALSSGLVPVRSGVFAGVVYLDEGSLAWEEGDRSNGDEQSSEIPETESPDSVVEPSEARGESYTAPIAPPSSSQGSSSTQIPPSGDPQPTGTLIPWIDLHMPPSSIPIPTEPPLMSVFDHSSESSGHEPIQIQIHDATIGEEGGGLAAAAAAYSHGATHAQTNGGLLPDGGNGTAPPAVPTPAPPPLQVLDDDPQADDVDRLYFSLFVHCRALRQFAGPEVSRADPNIRLCTHRPRIYEWDDWAPPIARLLTRMPMPAWACISHGQRFATLGFVGSGSSDPEGAADQATPTSTNIDNAHTLIIDPVNANGTLQFPNQDPNWFVDGGPSGANVKRPVRVLDFNPYGVRREKGKEVVGGNRTRIVDEPSILPAGKYWESDVRSALPYREVVTREELLLSGVMIDGERVLGMKSDERGNVSEMHVMQV